MNDICVYSIWIYEKQISHNHYYKIMTHEICDVQLWIVWALGKQLSKVEKT
jgi:hypothetical protein